MSPESLYGLPPKTPTKSYSDIREFESRLPLHYNRVAGWDDEYMKKRPRKNVSADHRASLWYMLEKN